MEPQAECMLVPIGATPEGKKELLGFQVGVRESAQSWRELLAGLKARGLMIAPELATGDGALGFWKALEEFPHSSPTIRDRVVQTAAKIVLDQCSRRISRTVPTAIGRVGARSMPSRKCTGCCAGAIPTLLTPTCRNLDGVS